MKFHLLDVTFEIIPLLSSLSYNILLSGGQVKEQTNKQNVMVTFCQYIITFSSEVSVSGKFQYVVKKFLKNC